MTWEAMESAMTAALYTGLGQSVTYTGRASASSTISAIVDDGAQIFGADSETAERVAVARVRVADVAAPRRGDLITMAAGTVYVVDGVERSSNMEWTLTMTERDR